jgi:hypothetical protein
MSGLNEHKVIFVLHILFERAMFKVELYEKQEKWIKICNFNKTIKHENIFCLYYMYS